MSKATRVKRGTKQPDTKPSRRQETFKVTSECAQQARRRAQQCFLSMIEGLVEPKAFIAKARYINPEVYDDVVLERALAGLCGYPMCPNIFTDTYGSRTYVIRNNKLYDITERRNFCSNVCFEASELVRKQVLTLPLYLRETQDSDIKDVRLPCLARLNGRHGKLVDITGGISNLDVDDNEKPRNNGTTFKSVDNIAIESLVNWSENEADLNSEQHKSTTGVIGSSNTNHSTESKDTDKTKLTVIEEIDGEHAKCAEGKVIESSKSNQTKIAVQINDVSQNTATAEETVIGEAKPTYVKDTDDSNQSRCIPVNSNTNRGKHTPESSKEQCTRSDKAEKETECESFDYPMSGAIVVDPFADVHKVEAMMRQWMSFDSLRVMLGDLYVKGMLEHLGHSWDNYDTTSGLRLGVEAKAKYVSICCQLEHEERQDEMERIGLDMFEMNSGKLSRPSKPLPDYSQLQHQAKKQQLKVVSFYGGSDQYEEPAEEKLESIPEEGEENSSIAKKKLKYKKQSENSDTRDPTLPFVDSYSQVAWRQNIVIEKVTAYLQQLLEMTRLSVHEVKKLLGSLVATFRLSPDNISFQPKQWRLITLILLKMLSFRYPAIQDAMKSEEGLNMQQAILSAFSLDLAYCDRVLSYLTEMQHILSKDFKDEKSLAPSQSGVHSKSCHKI